jgi:ABC-2 type transport system ATP-binding protein
MALIEVENLSKDFRTFKRKEGLTGALINLVHRDYEQVRAVDNISFQIEPGELVGYIGPNGAGKSTTIKMLTGILIPTSGRIQVDRFVPWRQRGSIPATSEWSSDSAPNSGGNRGGGVVQAFKEGLSGPEPLFEQRMERFKDLLEIGPLLPMPVRKLSLGQRMRCDLVARLLHNPRILFLDEPTIGLDVVGRMRIREFLGQINRDLGTTMILTTHDLDEIEKLCKRVLIIDHGNILYDGALQELRERYSRDRRITFQMSDDYSLPRIQSETDFGGAVEWKQIDSIRLQATFRRDRLRPAELIARVIQCAPVHDIAIEEQEIEEIVSQIYSDGRVDGGNPSQP